MARFLSRLFVIGAVGLFSLLTLLFDSFAVERWHRQSKAAAYATTNGRIAYSQLTTDCNDGNVYYGVDLRYRYEVGGQEYTGTRYRYGQIRSPNDTARQIVRSLPVGTQVTVYYDRENPAEAVLQQELDGTDGSMLLFMTPFNLIMLGGWVVLARLLYRWMACPPAGGVPIRDLAGRLSVRVGWGSPLSGAWVAAVGTSIVLNLAVGFACGAQLPISQLPAAWGVIAVAALAGGLGMAAWIGRGSADLLIDPFTRTLTLPPGSGRRYPTEILFDAIESVDLEEIEVHNGRDGMQTLYVPTITWLDSNGLSSCEKLPRWWDGDAAHQFVSWLRQQLQSPGNQRASESFSPWAEPMLSS